MKADNNLEQINTANSNKTTEQLHEEVIRLKKETDRLQAQSVNEEKYRAMFEQSSESLLIVDMKSGRFLEFNENAHKNLGYTRQEFKHLNIPDLEAALSPSEIDKHNNKVFSGINPVFETKHRHKNGQIRNVSIRLKAIITKGNKYLLAALSDTTEQKLSEKLLLEKKQELEDTVTAMNVLLEQIQTDKRIVKKNIFLHLEELVGPYIKKLYNICKDSEQKKYLEIIKSNLNQLSEEISNVSYLKDLKLTSSEMQVANLIKHNKSSKEISRKMNVAVSTVDFHRKNIRSKLSLKNSKTSLKSYLSTLQD